MDNYRELKIRCDPGFGHLHTYLKKLDKTEQDTLHPTFYIFVAVHNVRIKKNQQQSYIQRF